MYEPCTVCSVYSLASAAVRLRPAVASSPEALVGLWGLLAQAVISCVPPLGLMQPWLWWRRRCSRDLADEHAELRFSPEERQVSALQRPPGFILCSLPPCPGSAAHEGGQERNKGWP